MVTARPIDRYISLPPQSAAFPIDQYREPPSEAFIWFRLRQLADVPEQGMALFTGTLAERRARYKHFRAFVRQAQVYWEAASATRGSAAALPYYYAILQLAKAELLKTHSEKIEGRPIHHGLVHVNASGTKIRGDRVRWRQGVFSLLYEARTGLTLPAEVRPKAMSLLSLIPEISLEMSEVGRTRPSAMQAYHAVAMKDPDAWSLVLVPTDAVTAGEPSTRRLLRDYEQVDTVRNWREIFALSSRMYGGGLLMLQSKSTHTSNGTPDMAAACAQLVNSVGHHVAPPTVARADFYFLPALMKSRDLVLPLPLVRYAVMFYLSSVVRYQPTKLDAFTEGAQAYLMDSVVNELPIYLLASALDGITGVAAYYEPDQYRV